jgi:hypothetical protein
MGNKMRATTLRITSWLVLALLFACCAYSQTSGSPQTIEIWPGVAPGSEKWMQKKTTEDSPVGRIVFNVVTPTLTVFLPDRTKLPESQASRTGIIVAPGGGCIRLAMDLEGSKVPTGFGEKGLPYSCSNIASRKRRAKAFRPT